MTDNGEIDFHEFCVMMSDAMADNQSDGLHMRIAFDKIDVNGDGRICHTELRNAMLSLGDEISENEALEIIRAVDKDGDDHIDFEGTSHKVCV